MAKVLVTGSSGFVGSNLCKELCNSGYQVRALVRSKEKCKVLEGLPVEFAIGDITDRESLGAAMAGIDSVFHIAAVFREAKFPDEYYFKVNVEGTKNVFETAIAAGVKRVIHCSTNGVHSHIENPPADENEPFRPGDVYQVSKCEGEKCAMEYINSGQIEGVILRPAMIWGPGDRRILKLFKSIAHRRMPMIGSGKTLFHWILVSDLARAFRLANETPAANGQAYLIAGERIVTIQETYDAIAKVAGVALLPFKIPVLPFQLLGDVVEKICLPFGIEPPIHRRRANFFIKNRAFNCAKAKNELGFKAEYSFEEEVQIIYQWYKEQGWL